MVDENMTGADFAAARTRLGLTQAQLAFALGISLATLRRYEIETRVPRAISLAVSFLLLDANAPPPSADVASALAAYTSATVAAAALYRLAKRAGQTAVRAPSSSPTESTPGRHRMTPQEIAERNVEASSLAKKLRAARRRNERREEERPMIANIHDMVERIVSQNYTVAELHKALDVNIRMTENRHTFVHAYIEHVKAYGPVGRGDPIVTLPDEPLPF